MNSQQFDSINNDVQYIQSNHHIDICLQAGSLAIKGIAFTSFLITITAIALIIISGGTEIGLHLSGKAIPQILREIVYNSMLIGAGSTITGIGAAILDIQLSPRLGSS